MNPLDAVGAAAGIVIVAITFVDFFNAVVLPRPSVGRFSPSGAMLRQGWLVWRWLGTLRARPQWREAVLAAYGPLSVLVLLALRGLAFSLGYALILHAVRDQIHPHPESFGTTFYLAATSLTTLGLGDIYPTGAVARAVVDIEAATGLGLVATVISFLFSLFSSFQRREVAVVTLDALAGAPASGVQMLETCALHRMPQQLERTFDEWRHWSAEVLESHLAYPVLLYFRSSHDNEAWVNSFGAVMDAAVLVLSTLEDEPEGAAHLMLKVGGHLVEDVSWRRNYRGDGLPWVEREDFDEARRRLERVGYRVRPGDAAWAEFVRRRSVYASALIWIARYLAIQPASWIGDRSYLPHADRPAR